MFVCSACGLLGSQGEQVSGQLQVDARPGASTQCPPQLAPPVSTQVLDGHLAGCQAEPLTNW